MRLISFIDGERGYCTLVDGPAGGVALRLGAGEPLRAESPQPAEEGRAGLDSDAGPVEVSWSPAGPMLEFGVNGSGLSIYPVAASGSDPEGALSGPGVACDLPDGGWSAARTVWAITAKSRLIVLVALRPEDSREHGEEVVGAARIMPGDGSARLRRAAALDRIRRGRHPHAGDARALVGGRPPRRARRRHADRRRCDLDPYGRLEAARFAWAIRGTAAVGGYEIFTP